MANLSIILKDDIERDKSKKFPTAPYYSVDEANGEVQTLPRLESKKPFIFDENADMKSARVVLSFENYLKTSGPRDWINSYNFEKVMGGCIFTFKQPSSDPMEMIIGYRPMAIVKGDEKTLWIFPSSVAPKKVKEALSKENPAGEWLSWPQSKLIKKIEL